MDCRVCSLDTTFGNLGPKQISESMVITRCAKLLLIHSGYKHCHRHTYTWSGPAAEVCLDLVELTCQHPFDSALPHTPGEHVHHVRAVLLHCVIPTLVILEIDIRPGLGLLPMSTHPASSDSNPRLLGNQLGCCAELVVST